MVRPELAQLAVALDPLRPHSETRATARKAIRASPRRYDQMRPIPRPLRRRHREPEWAAERVDMALRALRDVTEGAGV